MFVVDGREGLIPGDQDIAKATRDAGVPVILAINKTDDRRARDAALEFSRLGFDRIVEISAEHGQGVGDLLEVIVEKLRHQPRARNPDARGTRSGAPGTHLEPDAPDAPRSEETAIAIVGRPNAGKSSLVNRLLREDRMIVSEVPGTTRDSVDSLLQWHRRTFRIVDTAGIRRPGQVAKSQVESVSVLLAQRAIERADVVVLVLDATVGPTDQDGAIAGAAKEAGRGIIIAANKWDLMKDQGPDASKVFDEKVRYHLKFLDYAPILHISAVTGERTPKLLEVVDRVAVAAPHARVDRGAQSVHREDHHAVAAGDGREAQRARDVCVAERAWRRRRSCCSPTRVTKLHFSYERFLENRLRETYGFFGNPIRIQVRGRKDPKRTGGRRRSARPSGGSR